MIRIWFCYLVSGILFIQSGNIIFSQSNFSFQSTREIEFENIYLTGGITSYVRKFVYRDMEDPDAKVFGLNTIRKNKSHVCDLTSTATIEPANCNNDNGSITVNAANGTAPYQYSLNGAAFQDGNIFNGLSQNNHTITVRDVNNCIYSFIAIVPLQINLTMTTTPDTTICNGTSFIPNTNSNAGSFIWSPASGVSDPAAARPELAPQASIAYTITGILGVCTTSRNLSVIVLPGANVNAGADTTIIAGEFYQLQGATSAGTYIWTPSTGLSAANILNPIAAPAITTTYYLNTTTDQGCFANDNMTITVVPYCLKPMDAFTPNGDGINDKWLITNGATCLIKAAVQVFNRYGAKIFESQDYKNTWDGTYNNKPLPDGTYYYVITFKLISGKSVGQKGNVTILR